MPWNKCILMICAPVAAVRKSSVVGVVELLYPMVGIGPKSLPVM